MCGRVYMAPANPELRELVREMNRSRLAARFQNEKHEMLNAEGECMPSSVMPVLAFSKAGEQRVFPMKWGFSQKSGLLINARVETASEKPTFQEAWQKHRCVIPASWYFEWEHKEKKKPGQKYALKPEFSGLTWLAGLYRMENDLPCFVILTRPATEELIWMHERMPVMLPESLIRQWINPDKPADEMINRCITKVVWQKAI